MSISNNVSENFHSFRSGGGCFGTVPAIGSGLLADIPYLAAAERGLFSFNSQGLMLSAHSFNSCIKVHFLYHYSLDFLLDIFTCVLKSPELNQTQDHMHRLNIIMSNLFQVIFNAALYISE